MSQIYVPRRTLIVAEANGVLLTTTATTNVLQITALRRGLYRITPYLEVANAATVVTAQATWTDPVKGADSFSWYTAQSLAVDDYSLVPLLVRSTGGGLITLVVTAGTANNVTVSGWIEGRA